MLSRYVSSSRRPWATSATCLRRHGSTNAGINEQVIQLLKEELQKELNNAEGANRYKMVTFKRALTAVGEINRPIHTLAELKSMKGIGPGITNRLGGRLLASNNISPELRREAEMNRIRNELSSLRGFGKGKVTKLIEAGCTGIKDLNKQQFHSLLSPSQKVRLKYQRHLAEPVFPEAAELVAQYIREMLPKDWEVIIVANFRRQIPISGVIPILVIHPESSYLPVPTHRFSQYRPHIRPRPFPPYVTREHRQNSPLYKNLLTPLEENSIIVGELDAGVKTWEGVIRLPEKILDGKEWELLYDRQQGVQNGTGTFRRLWLIAHPAKSRGSAMIAFTGDDEMYTTLRQQAHALGMYLDEVGLWKWHPEVRDGEEEKGFWQLLPSSTEEEIFKQLSVEWVEAEARNFELDF